MGGFDHIDNHENLLERELKNKMDAAMPHWEESNLEPVYAAQDINQTLREMEELRQKVHRRDIILLAGLAAVFLLPIVVTALPMFLWSGGLSLYVIGLIYIVYTAMVTYKGARDKIRLKKLYKETFIVQLLSEHFENVVYKWDSGFTEGYVRNIGLVRIGNRFRSEDYLSATYKGIHFEQADVVIRNHTSSGKSSHTTTYFRGRMFAFDYPQKMTQSIQVFSNNFQYRGQPAHNLQMHDVQMENVQFNKQYTVRACDSHEAFYVLTPHLMQRIDYLRSKYGNIAIHFDSGKLYVGFNSKRDAFDLDTSKKLDYQDEQGRVWEDVSVIKEIVNILESLP